MDQPGHQGRFSSPHLVQVGSALSRGRRSSCKKSQARDTGGDPPTLKSVGGVIERSAGNNGELLATICERDVKNVYA